MADSKTRKGQSKLAFPLGLAIIIFTVIGVIFTVGAGISGVKKLTDNSDKKIDYETMLTPVVMYDPDMFDDVSAAKLDQLTICAVWAVIKDESIYPGKYVTDDQGNIMIPYADVETKFAELFGTDVKPTHIGVKGNYDEFTYNEQNQCYLVTSAGSVPLYTPKVEKIEKHSNTVILTVGYLASEAWAQDRAGNFIQPEPSKYTKITLRENENGYYISAIQATDAPASAEPGVTIIAATTVVPQETTTADNTTQ